VPDRRFIDRDERGWRIPRAGTRSRAIYDGMLAGKRPIEIQADVGGTTQSISVLMWRIKHPVAANAITNRYRPKWCPWCQCAHVGACARLISGGQWD
jgi:hypothetical protein